MAWDVVIAGGGFGGLYAARALERKLPRHSARITLVSDANFMLYTPLLPGAAGGTLEPRHVVVPLREQLRDVQLRIGTVHGADPARHVLRVCDASGEERELRYDQLVVALGSVSRTFPVPGLAEHGVGFKTLPDAIELRNRLVRHLEIAESLEDPTAREPYLTFVFVGGGYSGLEGMAELQDFAASVLDRYPRCRQDGVRFVLVEARDRVMTEVPPRLAEFATRELRSRGMEIRLGTTVEEVREDAVRLSDGETIRSRTLTWTAGVKPHPVVGNLGLPLRDGRVVADRFMRVERHPNVWAIGDAAWVPDPARKGRPCPPTAQHAIRQGRRVAGNVAAALGHGRLRPFRYRTKGFFVDLGRHEAVAETLGVKWSGFPAWFMARTYHLAFMPGTGRKLRLVTDWTAGLLFPRDTSELGQLGHPSGLEAQSAGGTGAEAAALEAGPQASRALMDGDATPAPEEVAAS